MSGYRGGSPQMVEGDHEVDPPLSRKVVHLSGVLVVLVGVAGGLWGLLAYFDSAATTSLSSRPGAVWAFSALLFGGLAANLTGREYARRAEAVRTSTWRAARTSRSDASAAPADCRKCLVLRVENVALRAEVVALQAQVLVSPEPGSGPGQPWALPSVPPEPSVLPELLLAPRELPSAELETLSVPPQRADVVDVIEVFEVLEVPGEQELRETT